MLHIHTHTHTTLNIHKQLWIKYLEFRNTIERDGNLSQNYRHRYCLDVLSPKSVPSSLTTAGVEGLKPHLGYWASWRMRSQVGIFFLKSAWKQSYRTRNGCSHLYPKGESHSESFLQRRSGEVLWIMYELYDCTPSKSES